MQLRRARVTNYRSIEDSGWVELVDVTCLVGKNESGKTAFLQALRALNPASGDASFDATLDYPSRHYASYRRGGHEPAIVVEAVFELSADQVGELERFYGPGVLSSREVAVSKGYDARTLYAYGCDEARVVAHLAAQLELPAPARSRIAQADTLARLRDILAAIPDPHESVVTLLEDMGSWPDGSFDIHLIDRYLSAWLPRFLYFNEYSIMHGRVSLAELERRVTNGALEPSDQAVLALLYLGGVDVSEFASEQSFERLTRDLEAAANEISAEVFRYWTQNRELEVSAQVSAANAGDAPPLDRGPILNLRIRNQRHRVTVPFDERSRGFVWFFSFLAYFARLERGEQDLILLLDEPGLNLHATAQHDLLRFVEERLAPAHQVVYTTHSPFMVEPRRLDRVRTVVDVPDEGTRVSADLMAVDDETARPIWAAIGYALAEGLFGPECVLVEGASDLLYLQVLGGALDQRGRRGLDPRWRVVPIGGADRLAMFLALVGAQAPRLAVLLPSASGEELWAPDDGSAVLEPSSLVRVAEVTGAAHGDLEDVFEPSFYLELVTGAYEGRLRKKLTPGAVGKGRDPRIAVRVAEHFRREAIDGGRFDRLLPAMYLLREQGRLAPRIDDATLTRAEALFARLNELLPEG